MMVTSSPVKVYLRLGVTDMRKSINGLSVIVQGELKLDPFAGCFFVFCNRRQNILKILYWDKNGFCLWQKRLEKHHFRWPTDKSQIREINKEQLNWLLAGLDIGQAHKKLYYSSII
jgi:transposase